MRPVTLRRPFDGCPLRLRDKAIVVTGAARGLGRACAIAFAKEGADVALIDIGRDLPGVPYPMGTVSQLAFTAELCREHGAAVLTAHADVRDLVAVDHAVSGACGGFGGVGGLLDNAGVAAP